MYILLEISVSDGIVTALIGAVIAAAGYLGNLGFEIWRKRGERFTERRARLVDLESLLRASRTAFSIQKEHVEDIEGIIEKKYKTIDTSQGFDAAIAAAYPQFNEEEKKLFLIIRGITEHAMRPTNLALSEWLRNDRFFKAQKKSPRLGKLAELLGDLEAHLLLWHAKYEVWIVPGGNHCLVYMVDEQKHGLGFPNAIDGELKKVLDSF